MKRLGNISALLLLFMMTASCIYDYPVPVPAGATLDLHFKTERLITSDDPILNETDINSDEHDIRYVIQAFRLLKNGSFSREAAAEFIFTKDQISSLDNTVSLEIDEGTYRFYAWADYVPQDSTEDHHFNTTLFTDLHLNCEEYHANTDSKEAFVGSQVVEVVRYAEDMPVTCDTITLDRVLAKYHIISSDLKKFVSRMKNNKKNEETKAGGENEVNLDDYLIKITYSPDLFYTAIDLLNENTPIDGEFGVSYWSKIRPINDEEALIGFDHIFIKEGQQSIRASVSVYDRDTTLITVAPVEIPVSKDTVLSSSGDILTYIKLTGDEAMGDSGISIDPDFEGNLNIKI